MLRAGLLGVQLPPTFAVHLAFAQGGDLITDYSEGPMADLPQRIVNSYLNSNPLQGDVKHQHFWNALRSDASFPALDAELRARGGQLDAAFVLAALLRYYPRFPGDHTTVLDEHPGERSLIDWLEESLAQ